MIDKKSYNLLKEFYKSEHLNDKQIDVITHTQTPSNKLNSTALYLSRRQLIIRHYVSTDINGNSIYDGYEITSDGRAYVEERRRQFLTFILPYGITTFIALLSLFTTVATNWDSILKFLSTIFQNLR